MLSQCLQDFKVWCKTREEVELLEVTLGTPWLVWPQHLPSLLFSMPLCIFLLLLLSHLMLVPICTHQTSGTIFDVWSSLLALCSLPFLPSSFLPQGVLLHPLLLNIPEDELHSLHFYRRPLDNGFVWLFRTREMRPGGNLGSRRSGFQIHVCLHQLDLSIVVRIKHI